MATTIYLTDTASDINPGAEDERQATLSIGAGVVSATCTTVTGATSGVQLQRSGTNASWFTPPLCGVSLSNANLVTFNIWGSESNMSANAGFDVLVERTNRAGTVQSTIVRSERGTEMGFSGAAVNNWTANPTNTTLSDGDRIKITVFANDAGGTMASGFTVTLRYAGVTGGADGDTFVSFVETISPLPPPGLGPIPGQQMMHQSMPIF